MRGLAVFLMCFIGYMSFANDAPVADAGSDIEIVEGHIIQLNGTSSYDPEGMTLTYNWKCLVGGELLNGSTSTPIMSLPDIKSIREFFVELIVDDGLLLSTPDTVKVTVIDPSWDVVAQSNSSSLIAIANINNKVCESDDRIGAFSGGQCVGTDKIFYFQDSSYVVFNMQLEQPDSIEFLFYNYNTNELCTSNSKVFVAPGVPLGSFTSPHRLEFTCCSDSLVLTDDFGPIYGLFEAANVILGASGDDIRQLNNIEFNAPEFFISHGTMFNATTELIINQQGCN